MPFRDAASLLPAIRRLHLEVQRSVVEACEREDVDALSRVDAEGRGDTIYAVDRVSETVIRGFFEREVAPHTSLILVAEGIEGGRIVLPRGTREEDARWRVIADPIDGTRSLMYQKRSAWILTAVAPNRGEETDLADIALAVQTEIPLVKQHQADTLWAVRGGGAHAVRRDRLDGSERAIALRPSRASTFAHGFATVARFLPGARDVLAAIDDELAAGALSGLDRERAACFEDQYLSTGGQLHELAAGRDRFIADLRPLVGPLAAARGQPFGICCQPYDICTELIAREAGAVITDPSGNPLRARLSVEGDVAWVGYANPALRDLVAPLLEAALRSRGLLD